MLVEDDADILRIVEKYLVKWGFTVDAFSDPAEAWRHFQAQHVTCSIVLTDVRMPNMNGLELARLMKTLQPDVKIVLMTAFEISQIELETELPVVRYEDILKKPFKLAEVCNAIKKQLQAT